MNIIVDTSAIIAVILNEPEREDILSLTTGHRSMAPDSIYWEVGNALSSMFKRKTLTATEAVLALQAFEKMTLSYVSVDLQAAVTLAATRNIYAYDAYLLQCVIQHDAPLLTLDRPMFDHATDMKLSTIKVPQ